MKCGAPSSIFPPIPIRAPLPTMAAKNSSLCWKDVFVLNLKIIRSTRWKNTTPCTIRIMWAIAGQTAPMRTQKCSLFPHRLINFKKGKPSAQVSVRMVFLLIYACLLTRRRYIRNDFTCQLRRRHRLKPYFSRSFENRQKKAFTAEENI